MAAWRAVFGLRRLPRMFAKVSENAANRASLLSWSYVRGEDVYTHVSERSCSVRVGKKAVCLIVHESALAFDIEAFFPI